MGVSRVLVTKIFMQNSFLCIAWNTLQIFCVIILFYAILMDPSWNFCSPKIAVVGVVQKTFFSTSDSEHCCYNSNCSQWTRNKRKLPHQRLVVMYPTMTPKSSDIHLHQVPKKYVTSESCQANMNTTIKIADNNNGNNMMTMKKWLYNLTADEEESRLSNELVETH